MLTSRRACPDERRRDSLRHTQSLRLAMLAGGVVVAAAMGLIAVLGGATVPAVATPEGSVYAIARSGAALEEVASYLGGDPIRVPAGDALVGTDLARFADEGNVWLVERGLVDGALTSGVFRHLAEGVRRRGLLYTMLEATPADVSRALQEGRVVALRDLDEPVLAAFADADDQGGERLLGGQLPSQLDLAALVIAGFLALHLLGAQPLPHLILGHDQVAHLGQAHAQVGGQVAKHLLAQPRASMSNTAMIGLRGSSAGAGRATSPRAAHHQRRARRVMRDPPFRK